MADEDAIVEFATAGPKNYGYRTRLGTVECKVRGFSLNVRGQQQLNFDILKQTVLDEIRLPQEQPRTIPIFNPHKITRDVQTKKLLTLTEIKRYKIEADKRVVDRHSLQTFPYGFARVPWNDEDEHTVQTLLDSDSDE